MRSYADFDAFVKGWVNRNNIWKGLHFRPQSSFDLHQKNQPGLDFIGYYENLAADFDFICRKLEIKSTLMEANRNPSRKNLPGYYTDETREIVAEAYAGMTCGFWDTRSTIPACQNNWRSVVRTAG